MQKLVDLKAMAYRFLVVPVAGVLGLGGYGEEGKRERRRRGTRSGAHPLQRGVVVARFCPGRRRRHTVSRRAPGTGAAGHHGDVRRGKRSGRPSAGARRGRQHAWQGVAGQGLHSMAHARGWRNRAGRAQGGEQAAQVRRKNKREAQEIRRVRVFI